MLLLDDTPKITHLTVALVGVSNVGKTSIIETFIQAQPPSVPPAVTIEDCRTFQFVLPRIYKTLITPGPTSKQRPTKVVLTLVDLGGREEFRSLIESGVRSADAAMIFYDIGSRTSFDAVWDFYKEIIEVKECRPGEFPMVIVGNKADPMEQNKIVPREVSTTMLTKLAEVLNTHATETSMYNFSSITDAFTTLVLATQHRAEVFLASSKPHVSHSNTLARLVRQPSFASSIRSRISGTDRGKGNNSLSISSNYNSTKRDSISNLSNRESLQPRDSASQRGRDSSSQLKDSSSSSYRESNASFGSVYSSGNLPVTRNRSLNRSLSGAGHMRNITEESTPLFPQNSTSVPPPQQQQQQSVNSTSPTSPTSPTLDPPYLSKYSNAPINSIRHRRDIIFNAWSQLEKNRAQNEQLKKNNIHGLSPISTPSLPPSSNNNNNNNNNSIEENKGKLPKGFSYPAAMVSPRSDSAISVGSWGSRQAPTRHDSSLERRLKKGGGGYPPARYPMASPQRNNKKQNVHSNHQSSSVNETSNDGSLSLIDPNSKPLPPIPTKPISETQRHLQELLDQLETYDINDDDDNTINETSQDNSKSPTSSPSSSEVTPNPSVLGSNETVNEENTNKLSSIMEDTPSMTSSNSISTPPSNIELNSLHRSITLARARKELGARIVHGINVSKYSLGPKAVDLGLEELQGILEELDDEDVREIAGELGIQ